MAQYNYEIKKRWLLHIFKVKKADQIKVVCDQEAFADCKIRIMPDVHAGKGCTIGTTMTITDKIVHGMVGVDIGCGMETVLLDTNEIDFERLDKCIHKCIPAGFEVRDKAHKFADEIDLSELRCIRHVNIDRADNGELYLVVRRGSDVDPIPLTNGTPADVPLYFVFGDFIIIFNPPLICEVQLFHELP